MGNQAGFPPALVIPLFVREVVLALAEKTNVCAAPGGNQALSLEIWGVFVHMLGSEERAAHPATAEWGHEIVFVPGVTGCAYESSSGALTC